MITKSLNMATQSDAKGDKFFVVLSARPGVPGHAFVVWGIESKQHQMSDLSSGDFRRRRLFFGTSYLGQQT